MQIDERTYYEEEQKMEATWIMIIILVSSITSLGIAIGVLATQDKPNWTEIGIVVAAIVFTDTLIIFLFKNMKLEIALSKKGLHFSMRPTGGKNKIVPWEEVQAISIRKSVASGYGKKQKWRYGEVYAMNMKMGVELVLKNGKKKFFSLKDPEEFKRNFRKMELHLQIE